MTPPHVRSRLALLACTAGLLVTGCTTTVRQHPDFATRRAQISTVAVVPPTVEAVEVVFKGDNHPLPEETKHIEETLPGLIAAALEKKGFAVKEAGLDEPHYIERPDLRFQTTQLQSAFARADAQMFRVAAMSKSDAEHYKDTLGTDVIPIADQAAVDGLVVTKLNAFKKSGGEIAKDIAVSVLIAAATLGSAVIVQPTEGAALRVALVDGTTGEILWANVSGAGSAFKDSGLSAMVDQVFKGFPQ